MEVTQIRPAINRIDRKQILPPIYRVEIGPDRDKEIERKFKTWGFHKVSELVDCVNRYRRECWALRHPTEDEYCAEKLFWSFGLLNGFVCTRSFKFMPLLNWASSTSIGIETRYDMAWLDHLCQDQNLYVPSSWGMKILQLLNQRIISVEVVIDSSDSRLYGLEFDNNPANDGEYEGCRTPNFQHRRIPLDWKLIRKHRLSQFDGR